MTDQKQRSIDGGKYENNIDRSVEISDSRLSKREQNIQELMSKWFQNTPILTSYFALATQCSYFPHVEVKMIAPPSRKNGTFPLKFSQY